MPPDPVRFACASGSLDVESLCRLQHAPAPFAAGAMPFWDDPHISAQMLACHLDPIQGAASRPFAEIDRSVAWILGLLAPAPGARLVDLGCGPGLYAERFAARGLQVARIDYSRRSIAHAARSARERCLGIECRCQDYLGWQEDAAYDIAVLIYGDYCTMSPHQRGASLREDPPCPAPGRSPGARRLNAREPS